MKTKTIVLLGIITIFIITAVLVYLHPTISGEASILPGQVQKEKPFKPVYPPKPIKPSPYEPGILPIKECQEGARKCDGTNVIGCIGGQWIAMATCAPSRRICRNAQCTSPQPTCRSGETRCISNNLQRCISGEWIVTATCPARTYCTTEGCKQTQPTCENGQTRCRSNVLQACINENWLTTATCGQNQFCTRQQGCITIPQNIIFVQQGLSCPTKPSPPDTRMPDPIYKTDDCDLVGKKENIEQYLNALQNIVNACSQAQAQQINLASADKQYIDYQISTLYPAPPTIYPPTCPLLPITTTAQPAPTFAPATGKQYLTDWLKYITQTAQNYCAKTQSIINPVIDGCTNINANIPTCGTDYNAQTSYTGYLQGQMMQSINTVSEATALSTAFTFNTNQLRTAISQEIKC